MSWGKFIATAGLFGAYVAQPPVNHSLTLKPLDYKNNGAHATVINLLSKDF